MLSQTRWAERQRLHRLRRDARAARMLETEADERELSRLGRVLHDPGRRREIYMCGGGKRVCVNGAHFETDWLLRTMASLTSDGPQRELASLRLSVRRVGELAQQNGAGSLVIPEDGAERGWNRLCAGLADFIESGRE